MKKRITKFFITLSVVLLAVIMQVISVFSYPSSFDFLSGSGINIPAGHKKNMQSVSSNHFAILKATFTNDGSESESETEAEADDIDSKSFKKVFALSKYFSSFYSIDIPWYHTISVRKCLSIQEHFYYTVTQKRYILFEVFRI